MRRLLEGKPLFQGGAYLRPGAYKRKYGSFFAINTLVPFSNVVPSSNIDNVFLQDILSLEREIKQLHNTVLCKNLKYQIGLKGLLDSTDETIVSFRLRFLYIEKGRTKMKKLIQKPCHSD